jgi:hypothetical protein
MILAIGWWVGQEALMRGVAQVGAGTLQAPGIPHAEREEYTQEETLR